MSAASLHAVLVFTLVYLMLIFHHRISAAKLCDHSVSTFDCRGFGLTSIPAIPPNVTTVLFDDNLIAQIPDGVMESSPQLEYLSFKNNSIRQLHRNSFKGLVNLHFLHLGHNKLCLGNNSFPPGIFKSVPTLQTLNIVSNKCDSPQSQYYPESAFADLKSLKTFALSGIQSKLGHGFASMERLQTLMFMGATSNMAGLRNDTFEALGKLTITRLSLRNSRLYPVSPYLLSPLKNLEYLNLACNSFLMPMHIQGLIRNMAGPFLQTLSIDGTSLGTNEVIYMTLSDILHPNLRNLRRFSYHQIAIISLNTASLRFLTSLETLVLAHTVFSLQDANFNLLQVSEMFMNSSLKFVALPYFSDLKYDIATYKEEYCTPDEIDSEDSLFFRGIESYNYESGQLPEMKSPSQSPSCISTFDRRALHSLSFFETIFFQCLPPSVQTLSMDHSQMAVIERVLSLNINPMNNVQFLNLTQLVSSPQNINFKLFSKFPRVQVLEAKFCRIQSINEHFLNLSRLSELNLDNNDIERLYFSFDGLPSLNVLSIQNNRITHISPDVFKYLKTLTSLYLSGNFITTTFFLVKTLPLVMLDLSSNRIPYLEEKFLNQLERRSHSLVLNVTNNTLACSCNILPFSKWLTSTSVMVVDGHNLTCFDGTNNVKVFDALSRSQRLTCYAWFIPVMSILCIVIFFMVVLVLFYKFKWTIQLAYYIFRRRFRLQIKRRKCHFFAICCNKLYERMKHDGPTAYSYDGFLAHYGDDYDFIVNGFSDTIESWGTKLYISERDSEGGKPIVHNLVEAIDASRLVICLLTPGFAKSEWCDFELNMALDRGKDTVVFIYKEHIPWKMASKTLSKVLYEKKFLEYSEDPDGNRLFWRILRDILTEGTSIEEETNDRGDATEISDWTSSNRATDTDIETTDIDIFDPNKTTDV